MTLNQMAADIADKLLFARQDQEVAKLQAEAIDKFLAQARIDIIGIIENISLKIVEKKECKHVECECRKCGDAIGPIEWIKK